MNIENVRFMRAHRWHRWYLESTVTEHCDDAEQYHSGENSSGYDDSSRWHSTSSPSNPFRAREAEERGKDGGRQREGEGENREMWISVGLTFCWIFCVSTKGFYNACDDGGVFVYHRDVTATDETRWNRVVIVRLLSDSRGCLRPRRYEAVMD